MKAPYSISTRSAILHFAELSTSARAVLLRYRFSIIVKEMTSVRNEWTHCRCAPSLLSGRFGSRLSDRSYKPQLLLDELEHHGPVAKHGIALGGTNVGLPLIVSPLLF